MLIWYNGSMPSKPAKKQKTTIPALHGNPKMQEQPVLNQIDRGRISEEFFRLREKKNRTPEEEKEYGNAMLRWAAQYGVAQGRLPTLNADDDFRPFVEEVHLGLREEFGIVGMSRRLLIDRVTAAYSRALSYERMFKVRKYNIDEKGHYETLDISAPHLREIRCGIESADEQIFRGIQALRDLNGPRFTIQAKNAFFAQNQQVNQGASAPNDLEDAS